MRWFFGSQRAHPPAGPWGLKTHRVLLLAILVPVVIAAHALGAVTVSDLAHGLAPADQPVSFAVGGFVLIVVMAKLTHLVAFGAGLLRVRELLNRLRRRAGRPLHPETDGQ